MALVTEQRTEVTSMGRLLKRVKMDFDWPLNEVWEGYVNPHYKGIDCPHCEGGYSREYKALEALWYAHLGGGFRPEMRGSTPFMPDDEVVVTFVTKWLARDGLHEQWMIEAEARRRCDLWNGAWSHHLNEGDVAALVARGRLGDLVETVLGEGDVWMLAPGAVMPTAREVNVWSLGGFGHDSINSYVVICAELERLGQPVTCGHCNGEGDVWLSAEDRRIWDEWEPVEPPVGDGFQLWENTSEGSPVSPVFGSLDELCGWCEDYETTFGSQRASAARWREMLDAEFVCHREGNAIFI